MTQSESPIGECIYIRLGMGPPADPSDSSILSTKVGAPEQGRPCLLSSWLRRKVGRFARAAALERRGRRPQLECRLCASISLYDHCERVRAEQKRKLRTSSTSWTSDLRRCSAAQAGRRPFSRLLEIEMRNCSSLVCLRNAYLSNSVASPPRARHV